MKCNKCEEDREDFSYQVTHPEKLYSWCDACRAANPYVPKPRKPKAIKPAKPKTAQKKVNSSLNTIADLHNQRAAKLGINGRLCPKDLIIVRRQKRCTYCKSSRKLEFDHIVPLAKGGDNSRKNLQVLCHNCNTLKGAMMPETFEYKLALAIL